MSTLSTTELSRLRRKRVLYSKLGVAKATDKNYYMLIDLSNLSGNWPHKAPGSVGGPKASAGIIVYGARAVALAANLVDRYDVHLGVVLKLNTTVSADIAILNPIALENHEPNPSDLTVNTTTGKLLNTYATIKAADVGVRSSVNLVDPQGNNVLPQVGDLVFQVISANSQLATPAAPTDNIAYFEVSVWYDVL